MPFTGYYNRDAFRDFKKSIEVMSKIDIYFIRNGNDRNDFDPKKFTQAITVECQCDEVPKLSDVLK